MKLNTSKRKKFRVSNKVKKVASKERLRLCISRSLKNISAQIIDDSKNITLISASSVEKDIKNAAVKIAIKSVEKLIKNSLDKSKLDKIYNSSIEETKLALKKNSS